MNSSTIVRFGVLFFSSTITLSTYAYNPRHLEKFKLTSHCERCDLNELNLSPEVLGSSDYNDAILENSYFYGSSIEHLNMQNLKAQGLIGLGLLLHDNELSYADFSYADLPDLKVTLWNRGDYINFVGAAIDDANFSYTQFNAPQFIQASMSRAVLYHVQWPQANLSGARLRGADLTYARLQGANLQTANLSDALLNHADFTEANLFEAQVTQEQLAKTASVCNAILPDGTLGECD